MLLSIFIFHDLEWIIFWLLIHKEVDVFVAGTEKKVGEVGENWEMVWFWLGDVIIWLRWEGGYINPIITTTQIKLVKSHLIVLLGPWVNQAHM